MENTLSAGKGLIHGGIVCKVGASSRNIVERLETPNQPNFLYYGKAAQPTILCGIKESSGLNDEVVALSVIRDSAGFHKLLTSQDGQALTWAAPTAVSVGVANTAVLAAGATRARVILTNTTANNISLGFGGNNAVLLSGITLFPYGCIILQGAEATAEIEAIASAAASNLGVQVGVE
jgi:hypothetical protein